MEVLQPTPIAIFRITTQEEFAGIFNSLNLLCSFSQLDLPKDTMLYGLAESIGYFGVFFSAGVPIAWTAWEPYKTSVELHGVIRPDLERLFGYRVGAAIRIKLMTLVLDEWLVVLDKKKVFFKISSNNKSIERTARRYGFERLQNLDKGRFVYRLTQEEWLKRREETKGREKYDTLSVNKQL